MDVTAKARYIHMSPRKVRLVVDLVRGLTVAEADAQLSFFAKAAAKPVLKLLRSAVANAEHNFKLNRSDLRVKAATVDGGPTLKRFRPRAFGRAATIRKRTSHIAIVLTDEAVKAKGKEVTVAAKAPAAKKTPTRAKAPVKKTA